MDAIQRLLSDHRKVKNLFDQFKAAAHRQQQIRIFGQIFSELQLHSFVEETVFYPECDKHSELNELVADSYEDHRKLKEQLGKIVSLSQNSDDFAVLVEDMMEDVEDHVEEEESLLFPKAREVIGAQGLQDLVERMESARRERVSQAKEAA